MPAETAIGNFILEMAAYAVDAGFKHRAGQLGQRRALYIRREPAGIELELCRMLVLVAIGAFKVHPRRMVPRQPFCASHKVGGNLVHFSGRTVLYFLVAVEAGHMMLGHMVFVDERDIPEFLKLLGLVMAGQTPVFACSALAAYHAQMAIKAGYALLCDIILMIVGHIAQLKILIRKLMAGEAAAERLKVFTWAHALEMTQIAGIEGDFHVVAYHYLGMAGSTTKLPAAALLGQMRPVVESYAFIPDFNPAFKEPGSVAAGAKAGSVGHFRVRLGGIGARYILGHLRKRLELVPEVRLNGGWRIMAFNAGDFIMLGAVPGIIIRLHYMAGIAEIRRLRIMHQREHCHKTANNYNNSRYAETRSEADMQTVISLDIDA